MTKKITSWAIVATTERTYESKRLNKTFKKNATNKRGIFF